MTPSERLAFLAEELEYNAADPTGMKFDLNLWLKHPPDMDEPREGFGRDCGTVGCAVGLALLLPEFQAEGFSAKFDDFWNMQVPHFEDKTNFSAVERFFGISREAAYVLFHSNNYPGVEVTGAEGELNVAKRIRQYLNGQPLPRQRFP